MRGILISEEHRADRVCGIAETGMETALMDDYEFDDVAVHLLEPEESLDSEETGIDQDEGYSPPERPRELGEWGLTAAEARTHESLTRRLAREVPDVTDRWDGDGIGDSVDGDGEPIDGQVGDTVRVGSSLSTSIPQIPQPITAPTTSGSMAALPRLRKRRCTSSTMTTSSPTEVAVPIPAPCAPTSLCPHPGD